MNGARLGLIVVAAGSSTRMGGIDKAWTPLGGRPIVHHSLAELGAAAETIVLVVREDQLELARRELIGEFPAIRVVPGGAERQDSVRCGLEAMGDVAAVAVHDAARPFASRDLMTLGLQVLRTCDGAVPTEPVRDTLKRVSDAGHVIETIDRSSLRAAQTPQIFRTEPLRKAHREARGTSMTDDAALLEAIDYTVRTFPGLPQNFKITTQYDLRVAELLLSSGLLS